MGEVLSIEQRVNGNISTSAKIGDNIEARVVYAVSPNEFYQIEFKRLPGGSTVSTKVFQAPSQGGTFFVAFTWVVDYAVGTYELVARYLVRFNGSTVTSEVTAPHTITADAGALAPKAAVVNWFSDKTEAKGGEAVLFTAVIQNVGGEGNLKGVARFSEPLFVAELNQTVSQVDSMDLYKPSETKTLTFTVKMPASNPITISGSFDGAALNPITIRNLSAGGGGGEGSNLNTVTVPFWDKEGFFHPPATKSVNLTYTNLVTAVLNVDIRMAGFNRLDRVRFNGTEIATAGAVDVTNLVKIGVNTVIIDYSLIPPFIIPGVSAGVADISIDLTMDVTEEEFKRVTDKIVADNKPLFGEGDLSLRNVAILAGVSVLAVGGLALVLSLRRSPTEKAIEQLTQLEVAKAVRQR